MKWFNDSKIGLVLLTFVLGLVLNAATAKADFTFGQPVNLKSVIPVIDPTHDGIDCLSYDGLELYIDSNRSGGPLDWDLWVLRRASKDGDWGPPENLGPTINDPNVSGLASISADGLTLYFNSNRPGGYGDWDIYMTTRATKNDLWGPPVNLGPRVNSSANDGAPWISVDGLELYFHSLRSGGYGRGDIYVTRRATANDPWGEPVNLGPVANSAYPEIAPCVSPNGLVLFFSDTEEAPFRPGGYGGADMWMIRRTTISDPWQAPVNLGPKLNSSAHDTIPRISPDGRTLYFWTSLSTDPGTWNNWQAPIIPIVDFNYDGIVDIKDFSKLAQYWGQNESSVDIAPMAWGDGTVDMQDLTVLINYWLKEVFPVDLVAYWKLDETEGFLAHDSAGDHDGTLHGDPTWQPTAGKIDGAIELDGVDDYVSTPFVLNPADWQLSVFAWIKGSGSRQVIISQQNGLNWLGTDPFNFGWLMTELAAPGGRSLFSQAVITDGNWHRVGFVWDGKNRILYVDDVVVAKDAQDSLGESQGGLYIGGGKNLEADSFWTGLIDDVRIYDRAVQP